MAEKASDLINYKGMYFNDDTGNKNMDPLTGAHFIYKDMCRRLKTVMDSRHKYVQKLEELQIIQKK
jgi:hypothetical protein